MDLAFSSNTRLYRKSQLFLGQVQQYTSSLLESRDETQEDLLLSSSFSDPMDLTSKVQAVKDRYQFFKDQALKYASKKLEQANEQFSSLRNPGKYAGAMECLNTTKNPFRECMFAMTVCYADDRLKPPFPSSLASRSSGSSERYYYVPEPPRLTSRGLGDCEFSERIDDLGIPRDGFIKAVDAIISGSCVHPTARNLCKQWRDNRGLNEEDGELLLYLVLGRSYEWDIDTVVMDVATALESHVKVQEAIQSRVEALGISYDIYDFLEREIWNFVETRLAPRKAVDLVREITPILEEEGISLENLCHLFGPPKLFVQVGPHESILALHEGRAFVEDFYPLGEMADYPLGEKGIELGESHWGPVRDLGDFAGGLIVKIIKRNKYELRVRGLDNWNDDPAQEIATHRYLTSLGNPNIVRFEAVTMDNLNIYYYQERGVELFSTVKKHREKFWKQWQATLATKPKDYYFDHKSLWEQRMTTIFRGIFEGVAFMHSHRIAHRDLKLENMVAVGSEGDLVGKLIDFGVALRHGEWESDMHDHGKVGTYPFMSPEMCFNARRGNAVKSDVVIADYDSYDAAKNDVWTLAHALWGYSMGVLLWQDISSSDARFTIATRARFCANPSPWRFRPMGLRYLAKRYGANRTSMCTENLIDLMEKIMCPEEDRLTVGQCLEHPWFDDGASLI